MTQFDFIKKDMGGGVRQEKGDRNASVRSRSCAQSTFSIDCVRH